MYKGITVNRFQVDLANMERMFELYSFVGKKIQQNRTSAGSQSKLDSQDDNLKNIQSVEDLYKYLKNGETFSFSSDLIVDILNLFESSLESNSKETKLSNRIKTMEKELNEKNSKMSTLVEFPSSNDRTDDNNQELQQKIKQLKLDAQNMKKELESQYNRKEEETSKKIHKLEEDIRTKDTEIRKLQTVNNGAGNNTKDEAFNAEYYIKMIKQIEENYGMKAQDSEQDNFKKEQEVR